MRWVNKYKQTSEILRQNRKPVAYKLQKNEVKYIIKLIENDKTITMSNLLNKIKMKFTNFDVSRRYLSNVVKDNLVHGLISCKNCFNVWNRDVNGAINIYRIAKNAINELERPKYLCREKKDENVKV